LTSTAPSSPAYPELGAIISRVQSRFIRAVPPAEVFDLLLTDLIEFTQSEYGFIGEVVDVPDSGKRFLRIFVLTDISWSDATREMFERHRRGEPIEFHNLDTLFGAAITSGQPVIANDPKNDHRRGGLPGGHPGMATFLGVPLSHGGEMVGMVGLANRSGGYDEGLVEFLQPLFSSVGAIIGAVRLDAARRVAEEALRESEERLRNTFEMAAVGIAHVAPDGHFLRVNRRLCEILGRDSGSLLRMRFHDVTLPDDLNADLAQVQRLLSGQATSYIIEKRYRHGNGGVVWAEQFVTSSLAALFVATVPLWMVLIDAFRPTGHRPGLIAVTGILIGFGGVVLLIGSVASGADAENLLGAAALIVASLAWTMGSLYGKSARLPASGTLRPPPRHGNR